MGAEVFSCLDTCWGVNAPASERTAGSTESVLAIANVTILLRIHEPRVTISHD